jgi:hypothetical protein
MKIDQEVLTAALISEASKPNEEETTECLSSHPLVLHTIVRLRELNSLYPDSERSSLGAAFEMGFKGGIEYARMLRERAL